MAAATALAQSTLWADEARPASTGARGNWIAVASATHARRGCAEPDAGYMQVCHGKVAPLRRVKPGDRVAYYAPTVTMGGSDKLQAFVSLGLVRPGEPYAFDMGGGFVPFRRRVRYVRARSVLLERLKDQLALCARPNWGIALRRGHLALAPEDLRTIAAAMGAAIDDASVEARAS